MIPSKWLISLAATLLMALTSSALAQPQKYALVTGINKYPRMSAKAQLEGCLSDANRMRDMLRNEYDFPALNVEVITNEQATRNGIISKIQAFQGKVKSGDLFVFYYSGHGSLFPDAMSEEKDETELLPEMRLPATNELIAPSGRYDSAICPSDSGGRLPGAKPWGNMILDDELFAMFQHFTRAGCTVVFISDSCHSGSVGRNLDGDYRVKAVPVTEALGQSLSEIVAPVNQRQVGARDMQGKYLVIASSKVTQTSGEGVLGGVQTGFFTHMFLEMVKLGNKNLGKAKITYKQAFVPVQTILKQKTPSKQEPQLDTRYYNASLDVPMFSVGEKPAPPPPVIAPNTAPSAPKRYRAIVAVEDAAGKPLDKCSFIVFKPGMYAEKGSITKDHALILGRTDATGKYDGGANAPLIAPGKYKMKIVREGYKSAIGDMEVRATNQPGDTALIVVRLEKE